MVYKSPAGTWETHWKVLNDTHLELSLTVPFGCTADVVLPYVPAVLFAEDNNVLFHNVTDGVCHVGPGKYEIAYETTEILRKVYSIDSQIGDLAANPTVAAALTEAFPKFAGITGQYRSVPLRDYARFTGEISAEELEPIDALLRAIE